MKCFLIAVMSADGCIARDTSQASFLWNSEEDKRRFVELTKKAGVIVVGRNTYQTFGRPLKERLNIVYTHASTAELKAEFENVETTQLSPVELLKELEDRGYKELAICGGSQIYTQFMKAGVIDTLYLSVEPVIFGAGIPLFQEDVHHLLELKSCEKTEKGTLLLEYKVIFGGV